MGSENGEPREQRDPEDHRPDVLRGGRLEGIRASSGAVPDVVADEVGNNRGIPRIVLGDSYFHFAHKVRTDIRRLRVDSATKLCEQRNETCPKAESDDGQDEVVLTVVA